MAEEPQKTNMHELMIRFAKTVECGGVSAAARELHISQPAVTKSLHQLSSHYGVPLLTRGKQGVTPTEYGQIVYRLAKLLQKSLEDVGNEIEARRKDRAGSVSIGAGLLWCYVYLPAAVESISRLLPRLKVNILLRPPAILHEMVCQGELDIGLGQMPSDRHAGIVYEELLVSRSALFAHCDHPLNSKKRIRDSHLRQYPCAVFAAADNEVATTISGGSEYHVTTMDNLLLSCLLMQDKRHLMRLPRALAGILAKFDLVPLPHCSTDVEFVSGLYYRESALLRSTSRDVIEEIRKVSRASHSVNRTDPHQ